MMILIPSNNSFYSPDHPWVSQRSKSTNTLSSQATPEDYEGRTEKTGDKFTLTNDTDGQSLTRDTVRPVSRVCLKLWGHGARFVMAAGRRQSWPLVFQTGLEMSSLGNFSFTYLHPTHNATKISGETNTEQPNQKISYPSTVRMTYPIQESSALWLNVLLVLYTFHAILFFV